MNKITLLVLGTIFTSMSQQLSASETPRPEDSMTSKSPEQEVPYQPTPVSSYQTNTPLNVPGSYEFTITVNTSIKLILGKSQNSFFCIQATGDKEFLDNVLLSFQHKQVLIQDSNGVNNKNITECNTNSHNTDTTKSKTESELNHTGIIKHNNERCTETNNLIIYNKVKKSNRHKSKSKSETDGVPITQTFNYNYTVYNITENQGTLQDDHSKIESNTQTKPAGWMPINENYIPETKPVHELTKNESVTQQEQEIVSNDKDTPPTEDTPPEESRKTSVPQPTSQKEENKPQQPPKIPTEINILVPAHPRLTLNGQGDSQIYANRVDFSMLSIHLTQSASLEMGDFRTECLKIDTKGNSKARFNNGNGPELTFRVDGHSQVTYDCLSGSSLSFLRIKGRSYGNIRFEGNGVELSERVKIALKDKSESTLTRCNIAGFTLNVTLKAPANLEFNKRSSKN
jgi:hypothetical protein